MKHFSTLIFRISLGLFTLAQFSLAAEKTQAINYSKIPAPKTEEAVIKKENINYTTQLGDLSRSKEWRRLLYYKKNLFGSFVSEVSNPDFFLSSKGKTNPEIELKTSLQKFAKLKT